MHRNYEFHEQSFLLLYQAIGIRGFLHDVMFMDLIILGETKELITKKCPKNSFGVRLIH